MPNDEVSQELARRYWANEAVTFEDIFLRWDRRTMEAQQDMLDPSRYTSTDPFDQKIMSAAMEASKQSTNIWRRVGAAAVKNREILYLAANKHQPLPHTNWIDGDPRNSSNRGASIDNSTDMHAEARIIALAAKEGRELNGADVYVTTFPCPTCAKLIANAGIRTCFYAVGYAMLDGQEVLDANGVHLVQVKGVPSDDSHQDIWVPYPER
jgi:dCMP deaminase